MDNKHYDLSDYPTDQPAVGGRVEPVVMSNLTEPLNQCDGCMAGLPLINGVHKDNQMFGIGCTKHLYVKSS